MHVLGRRDGDDGPAGRLGTYRARDGSDGAAVGVDFERPHAALVVGKRGSGKSHTLGVLAEEAVDARGVAPVVLDPMGAFAELDADGRSDVLTPAVRAAAIPPKTWPTLVGLDATGSAGALVWEAARACDSLPTMRRYVRASEAAGPATRAATNHLRMAASWGVFDADGLDAAALCGPAATVLDCAGLSEPATNAVGYAVAHALYEARVTEAVSRLPWLFADEAHAFFDGVAAAALRTLLTRGRAPGVSLVVATQRPASVPPVAHAQADLLVTHTLTSAADRDAVVAASPANLAGEVRTRIPTERGCALVVDDESPEVHDVRVRPRTTPHGGASPRASLVEDGAADEDANGGEKTNEVASRTDASLADGRSRERPDRDLNPSHDRDRVV